MEWPNPASPVISRKSSSYQRWNRTKPTYLLAKRWREHGDREAAHRLVTSHLRLVVKIVMGYRGYGLVISEMISEGNIGLN